MFWQIKKSVNTRVMQAPHKKIKLSQIYLYFFLWVTFSREGNYEKV